MRFPAIVSSSLPRRLRAVIVPLVAALTLGACQGMTLFEKGRATQASPPASAPAQPPASAAPAPVTPAPPAPVEGENLPPPGGGPGAPAVPPAEGAPQTPRVALLLPLSGPSAPLGKALLNAAELALFDSADEHFTLLPRDTGGTPEGAERAARAVLDEGARLILGPFFAAEVSAATPLARQAGVNVIAFSTDERVAGQGVFLMGFLPRTQVMRVVGFAHARGLNRFAGIVPDTAYGQAISALLREAATQAGADVAEIETYDPAAGDAARVVRRLGNYESRRAALLAQRKQLAAKNDEVSRQALQRLDAEDTLGQVGFDSVMLPEGGEQLLALAPLLPYYDINPGEVRLLGTGLWDDSRLGKEPTLLGGWYAAPDPRARADFEQRFTKLYGAGPPPRIATLGYDAAALAVALAHSEGGANFSVAAIVNPNGFAGLDGIFRFRADGLSERGLAVLEVQRDGPRLVSPAPVSFAGE